MVFYDISHTIKIRAENQPLARETGLESLSNQCVCT